MSRTVPVLVALVAALLTSPLPASAQSCEPPATVDLITGASSTGVVGVVEYQVIAKNSLAFGKSVGASRRIWGDVQADRWQVTESNSGCPTTPTDSLGSAWYLLLGLEDESGRAVYGVPSGPEISDLEVGALEALIARPVEVAIGDADRAMAWLRVNWWVVAGVSVVPLLGVAVFLRRRSGARRDYLF